MIKHLLAVLTGISLFVSIFAPMSFGAGANASDSKDVFNDLIEITQGHLEESVAETSNDDYNNLVNRTIAMILNTALSMNSENMYRLVLESIYGGTDGSVENLMENAKTVWSALGSVMVAQHKGMASTGEGNNRVYQDMTSVNNVVGALKQVLGARAGNLSPGMSVDEVWKTLCDMSKQEFGEEGGEFSWEESIPGGGTRTIGVGDQVFFSVSARMGAKSVHASYEDPFKQYVGGSKSGTTEYLEREYLNDQNLTSFTVTPGSSVTMQWCGIVVNVDDVSGGIRAICGNIDLSGLGSSGYTKQMDREGNVTGTLSAESVDGSTGTVKLKSGNSIDPEWEIIITTKFCHNKIDYNALKAAMYSSIELPDGNMLEIDPDNEDLVNDLMRRGGLAEDEACLVAAKVRLLKMYTDMTFDGVPQAEALAWLQAVQFASGGDDGLSSDSIYGNFTKEYQDKYDEWAKKQGISEDNKNISSLTNFMLNLMNEDAIISQQVHAVALANVTSDNLDDQVIQNLANILKFFGGNDSTDRLAADIIDGRKYFDLNSVSGQLWKFLHELGDGVVDVSYRVPNAPGGIGNGTPEFINDLKGPSNADITVPTSISISNRKSYY